MPHFIFFLSLRVPMRILFSRNMRHSLLSVSCMGKGGETSPQAWLLAP